MTIFVTASDEGDETEKVDKPFKSRYLWLSPF